MKKIKKIVCLLLCLTMIFAVAGCNSNKKNQKDSDVTTITWYVPGVLDCADKDEVMDKVNELLAKRYKLNVELIFIDGGNYASKMQTINAGGEEYDLSFVSNWRNDYYTNVANGTLVDLTELLDKYPDLKNSMNDNVWDASRVDGKIYAIPSWQIQAKSTSLAIDTEVLKQSGYTLDQINTLDDIGKYMQSLHKTMPECNMVGQVWSSLTYKYNILTLLGDTLPAAIYVTDDGSKPKVMNMYESPEFSEYVNTRYKWVQEGIMSDMYDAIAMKKGSNKDVRTTPFSIHIYKPGLKGELELSTGTDYSVKQFSNAVLSSSGVCAAMTGISTTSKHPDKALELLNAINKDKEIMNLLCWGIEGKHYTKVSDTQIKIADNSGYSRINSFVLGSNYGTYCLENQDPDLYEQVKTFNDTAIVSPLNGLNLNTSSITTESANCNNIIKEQLESLERGAVDPKTALPKFIKDLKTAGSDKIIQEIQKQVDSWWASKK